MRTFYQIYRDGININAHYTAMIISVIFSKLANYVQEIKQESHQLIVRYEPNNLKEGINAINEVKIGRNFIQVSTPLGSEDAKLMFDTITDKENTGLLFCGYQPDINMSSNSLPF